jgi:hypothetical protein
MFVNATQGCCRHLRGQASIGSCNSPLCNNRAERNHPDIFSGRFLKSVPDIVVFTTLKIDFSPVEKPRGKNVDNGWNENLQRHEHAPGF